MHFPIYNAAETTLQQLIQVAGRAGRASQESQVIIQAMIDHAVFQQVNERDYRQFYEKEIEQRKIVGYPPITRLAEIELKHSDEKRIDQEAQTIVRLLEQHAASFQDVCILGPAKPPVHKIKNVFSRKIYLKSSSIKDLIELYRKIPKKVFKSHIFYTPNPTS